MNIDKKIIRSLAKLLREEGLTEIDIGQGESYIRISQNISAPVLEKRTTASPDASPEKQGSEGNIVKAPMVGMAYLTPEPGSPPYITEGKAVKEGDTLMIIEAMKTMNYIKSPYSGTVKKIIVKQGDPVEFDQPLFVII